MGEETEKIIEKVRNYAFLYDTSHHLYKNVLKKAETWQMIAEELDMTSKYMLLIFHIISDSFISQYCYRVYRKVAEAVSLIFWSEENKIKYGIKNDK